jgi:hypothetical protein
MFLKLAIGFLLLAVTVLIHGFGLALMMWRVPMPKTLCSSRIVPRAWLLIRVAAWVVTIHWIEIAVWACFYSWQQCLPDFESSLYFSLTTYTTVGYGDIVLRDGWRILAGVEALTGILMCGWSTAFFLTTASRIYGAGGSRISWDHSDSGPASTTESR